MLLSVKLRIVDPCCPFVLEMQASSLDAVRSSPGRGCSCGSGITVKQYQTARQARRHPHKWGHMRPFRLTTLVTGVALIVFAALCAGHQVLADSVEPSPLEIGNGDTICRSEDIVIAAQPPAISESRCPEHGTETHDTVRARAYLIETATPGYTMTRQGPERAIGRLHPEFVVRLAAAIAEARAAGLSFAGIFSAYRPPAFGIGGFADKFHSLHTYGLAVDVTGIGAAGTPSALLWHEIAARQGVICPYGPHNLSEWNHCQPTWVKIILPDNPLRETVTADGPISLEGMFEVGYSLIASSGPVGAPTADPPAHFFKQPLVRTAMAVDPRTKTANDRTTPNTAQASLDRYAMRWPPLSGGKVGWPKGVPRIAKLDDETSRSGSRAANRKLSQPSLITIPPVRGYSVSRSVIPSAHKNVERQRQTRSSTKVPIGASLRRPVVHWRLRRTPTQPAGTKTTSAQAQRDCRFFSVEAHRSSDIITL